MPNDIIVLDENDEVLPSPLVTKEDLKYHSWQMNSKTINLYPRFLKQLAEHSGIPILIFNKYWNAREIMEARKSASVVSILKKH